MSRPIEEIEAELNRARNRCSEYENMISIAERELEEWSQWVYELHEELKQAKKEAGEQ